MPINVRILAATNRDLERAVTEGTFRRDLFFRLNVLTLRIPPLRERRQDIPLLVAHFLERIGRDAGWRRQFRTRRSRRCSITTGQVTYENWKTRWSGRVR